MCPGNFAILVELVFCIVTWATCIITGPGLACDDTKKFFEEGKLCISLGEKRRQTANLYYAYAVDTLTNLMVMFLPIRLIWNLQMERAKKIGCGLLFASGFVCILFSTTRIVQVGRDGKPQSPDPKWLTLWTIVECSTAVIIGCCPVLAAVVPKRWARLLNRVAYSTQGYIQQSPNQSDETACGSHRLRNMHTSGKKKRPSKDTPEPVSVASQDELPERRTGGTGIRITDEMREQHRRRMEDQRTREEHAEALRPDM